MHAYSFFQDALIYLFAAIIAVPLSKRFGLGSVLGFLLAGVVIGPSCLKLVTNVNVILNFSELGIVLLLFLVGLELNPARLWRLRRSILGMGSSQVLITIGIAAGVCYLFKIPFTIALVAAMGLAMSSTAIALQTLNEKNLLGTPAGQASFSVLLFQDLTVIPLMLILSLLAPTSGLVTAKAAEPHWLLAVKAIGLIIGLILAGRYLLRPLLRIVANTGLREIFIACSLLLVLGTASLMESVGLSMALGTFLAGVMLADSEYRYQLELDIEPFKGLLLGLFFIAIGMSINIQLLHQHLLLVISLALVVVLGKMLILYPLARSFKENPKDAQIFAITLSQVGEFAFVLFNVAFSNHILTPDQNSLLNLIVAMSMLTTPFLVMLYEKVITPLQKQVNRRPDADIIEERNPVIIAGFGRVGGMIARLLLAKGIHTTVIDHNPNQIELVRRFGFRAYYGDITRLDLLHAAGAKTAKLLILAIDDSRAALATAELVKNHFPHLKVLARARNRLDAYEFIEMEIPVVRETFLSALAIGELALQELGYSAYSAHRAVQRFQKHDETLLKTSFQHRHDQQALISLAQQGREELSKLLQGEEKLHQGASESGW